MVKAPFGRISTVCIIFLLLPLGSIVAGKNSTSARDNENQPNDPPQVILDEQTYEYLGDESLNITGRIIDENQPIVYWSLYGSNLSESNGLNSHIIQWTGVEGTSSSARSAWTFKIELDTYWLEQFVPCTCEIIVFARDAWGDHMNFDSVLIFATDGPEIPARIIFDNFGQREHSRYTGEIMFEGLALDYESQVSAVQWYLSDGEDAQCSTNTPIPQASPQSDEWNDVAELGSEGNFSLLVDASQFEEGAYDLFVRPLEDGTLIEDSICTCLRFETDNNPPTANITGPTNVNESSNVITFDGSGSSDHFWGKESLTYLWTLVEDSWTPEQMVFESGFGQSIFEYNATDSGQYTLTLTVADNAGFSDTVVHKFNITNRAPVADLRIDGQRLNDGDSITLLDFNHWWIDCSDSFDTENDLPGLVCTWHIDGEELMTGWRRQLVQPNDNSKPHTLILVVADNDGATDTISVTFGIKDTASDPATYNKEEGDSSPLLLISVLISIALICSAVAIIYRRKGSAIPKWEQDKNLE